MSEKLPWKKAAKKWYHERGVWSRVVNVMEEWKNEKDKELKKANERIGELERKIRVMERYLVTGGVA